MSYRPPFTITSEILNSIADIRQEANSTPFIHFMLSVITRTLAKNAPVNAPVNASVKIDGLKTPEAILRLYSHCLRADGVRDPLVRTTASIGAKRKK